MPATIFSAAVYGLDARLVTVEVDVRRGMPKIFIVGLPDAAVQEARERIRSAIINAGGEFPYQRITINLSPANWRKEGAGFDLPVAIGLLIAAGQLPAEVFERTMIIGELGLNGQVRPTNGVLAVAELARSRGWRLLVPEENAAEARMIQNLSVGPIKHLGQLFSWTARGADFDQHFSIEATDPWNGQEVWDVWPTIIGQTQAKRAMVIAAAGHHNVLLSGPPGSGKTMLAHGVQELFPPLLEPEALAITKIHSVAGQLPAGQNLVIRRPFRQPHHTASVAAVVGGGRVPKPGELSLAHHGILFLDEFPEFSREHVEALRQPLEEGRVVINRVSGTMVFPAGGMIVAAMNPCPCGWLHDQQQVCRCQPAAISRYRRRLSGPILDRFDLFVNVPRLRSIEARQAAGDDPRADVLAARQRQRQRNPTDAPLNSQLRGRALQTMCPLDDETEKLLRVAIDRLALSMRGVHRVIRVARTIADVVDGDQIEAGHLAEALQYRPPASF